MWKLNEKDIPGMKHCTRILTYNELIKRQIKLSAAFTVRFQISLPQTLDEIALFTKIY